MRRKRGAWLTALASSPPVLQVGAGGRAGALASSTDLPRVRHSSEARFPISAPHCAGHGRARLKLKHYSLFNMPVAVPCASLPLFTSAIVPLHVSTTILDRRQTAAVVTGTWDLAMHRCLSRTAPAYRSLRILLPLHDDLLCAPSTFVLLLSTSRQVECRVPSAAARCMIPLCQFENFVPKLQTRSC
jgi:hypothetical protein